MRGVPCYLIDLGDKVFDDVLSFQGEVSLWQVYNKRGGNDRTITALEKQFRELTGTCVANVLAGYEQGLRINTLPTFDAGRRSPAMLAARQVRIVSALSEMHETARTVSARGYELSRLVQFRKAAANRKPLELRSDRGGMLYAHEVVDRFEAAYGWMAHGEDAGEEMLVSVVMTTYNAEETVRWAVRSLLEQDHRLLELIIVDDVSTDATRDLLLQLRQSDDRIRLIFLPRNRGTYFAKNVGILHASGKVVTFQDADDWSHPARLRLQFWRLIKSGAVATRCSYVRHHARTNQLVKVNGRVESPGFITLMVWRELFERDGYFDCARRAADDELICRLLSLHGPDAVDTFMLPIYVALYSDQSLIADSSEYSAESGLRFCLSEDRESYKRAFIEWHQRLQQDAALKSAYTFPPRSIFIEKLPSLQAFDPAEIDDLASELGDVEVLG